MMLTYISKTSLATLKFKVIKMRGIMYDGSEDSKKAIKDMYKEVSGYGVSKEEFAKKLSGTIKNVEKYCVPVHKLTQDVMKELFEDCHEQGLDGDDVANNINSVATNILANVMTFLYPMLAIDDANKKSVIFDMIRTSEDHYDKHKEEHQKNGDTDGKKKE